MSLDLLTIAEDAAREALRGSPLGGLLRGEIVVDLFCGGGGATQGIEDAGLVVHECVNHCPTAIATHTANHPATNHRRGDVWRNTPEDVAAGRPVGLLWASPDCRHFSRARGAAPVSRRVRDLAWVVTRWAKGNGQMAKSANGQRGGGDARPRVIIVENVPEFLDWGPTRARVDAGGAAVVDAQGRVVMEPVPHRKGETFRRWRRLLERAGYVVEWRVLDAADFGAASRRKRLYVIARRDGQPICWPEVTHGHGRHGHQAARAQGALRIEQAGGARSGGGGRVAGPAIRAGAAARGVSGGRSAQDGPGAGGPDDQGLRPHRAAAEVIDWSDLGTSIFERKRPLKPKTLARIAEGIRRYVLNSASPFVLRVTQTGDGRGWKVRGVDEPLPTATTRQDLAVCTPVIQANRGNATPRSPGEPLPTITAGNGPGRGAGAGHAISVATPILAPQNGGVFGQPVDRPGPTITTKGHQSLITPVLATTGYGEREGQRPRCQAVAELLGTCVNGAKQAVVSPVLAVCAHGDGPDGKARWGRSSLPVDGPLNAIHAGGNNFGLVAPVLMSAGGPECKAVPAGDPMGTVLPRDHRALVAALLVKFYGAEKGGQDARRPLGTVTTLDRHGLVCCVIDGVEFVIVDILFRMLKPRELAAAMGFPATYQWPATQREAVRLIGNAVSPPQAAALVRAVFPRGMDRGEEEGRAVA